ncbi:hypothetical protein TNCV_4327881 [Trichonephila clavipes]|nr:hypothetical protein TNCV_4327881 [Trichonephila clavipes]
MPLTGIGEAQVTTIGSFEHKFKIDDENYSLTWHVVPADKLKIEAVIGSDLEQTPITTLDLRHVENRQNQEESLKSQFKTTSQKNSIYRRHNENYSKKTKNQFVNTLVD